MRRWFAELCLCVVITGSAGLAFAQPSESGMANDLYTAGKRLDALPLYEELAKAHPDVWIYQERLADCLSVKARDSAPDEAKALRTRVRDAARRAVELGDPNAYMKELANIDPNAIPGPIAPGSAGGDLIEEAEKAFRVGDYPTALAKYSQAADADPQLYEAPLWAGDMEFRNKNAPAAGKWFARAIQVNPNRETAYRYWGDTLLRVSNDPVAAKEKYIAAIIAEPYNRLAWQGIQNWAVRQKAVLLAPKIDRPQAPVADPNKPGNMTINIDPSDIGNKHPGGSAWLIYSMVRASYRTEKFAKDYPAEKPIATP
jgi:tetratricopeptide (TPR) repeat protein